jgi:hypothetical protein
MRALWSTATCSVASGATTEQSRSDWKSLPGLPHSMAEAGSEQQCANGGFMLPHGLSTPGNLQGFVALSSRNCSAAACQRRSLFRPDACVTISALTGAARSRNHA